MFLYQRFIQAKISVFHKKREEAGLKHVKDFKAFIEYSNDMSNVYSNIAEYNPRKKRKVLVVFGDMIADMINKNNFTQYSLSYFLGVGNYISHNNISRYQRI